MVASIFFTPLSTWQPGFGPSLLLTVNGDKFLFNCPEQTVRLSDHYSLHISTTLKCFFATRASPSALGGLNPLLLSRHIDRLKLMGPTGLRDFVLSSQTHVHRPDTSVLLVENPVEPLLHSDLSVIPISAVGSESKLELFLNWSRHRGPHYHSASAHQRHATSYAIQCAAIPGRLDPKKAVQLGVKPGPAFSQLKAGQSVRSADGTEVFPNQVVSPDVPGPVCLVLDICNSEDLAHLTSGVLNQYTGPESRLQYVFHFAERQWLANPEYLGWLSTFPPTAKHFVQVQFDRTQHQYLLTYQQFLNSLAPTIFPLFPSPPQETPVALPFSAASTMHHYRLLPKLSGPEPMGSIAGRNRHLEYYVVEDSGHPLDASEDELYFLGTGAAQSAPERSNSAILLRTAGGKYALLDCGGGTLTQLALSHTPEQLNHILANLKFVFISHRHIDHMGGLVDLLQARADLLDLGRDARSYRVGGHGCVVCGAQFPSELACLRHHSIHEPMPRSADGVARLPFPELTRCAVESVPSSWTPNASDLLVVAPFWLYSWLADLSPCVDLHCQYVDCDELLPQAHGLATWFREELGLLVRTYEVLHSYPAYALSLQHDSWSLVYSGDTRPSQDLIDAVPRPLTLLIHEATFEEDLLDKAKHDRHSTTMEAIEVGNLIRLTARG